MKAIIYCRVSTKEQAERFSLSAQEKTCRQYAERNGYDVTKVFVEKGESAKTIDRTELNQLIQFASKNHKNIDALIVSQIDRLSREPIDYFKLGEFFIKTDIKIKSATQNIDETPMGRFMEHLFIGIAKLENDERGEKTKSGMKQAVSEGYWCWPAPAGYRFARDDSNKSILVPTEEGKFIKEAFELVETGLYKQTEIVEKLRRKGFKRIRKQYLNRILRNPIYASLIRARKWFPEDIKGKHEYLVSENTFFKVQAILNGKRPSITPRLRNHPDFPLRNFVRCAKCGQKLTGSWSTGRKKRYPYYHHGTKGCSLTVPKELLESKFIDLLESVQPKQEILQLFEAIVVDVWKDKQQESLGDKSKLEKKVKELETKRNKIDDLVIEGVFNEDIYKKNVERVEEDMMLVKIELNEAKIKPSDVESCLNYCNYFLLNCVSLWVGAELDLRQRFQSLIFPQGISYDGKVFGTTPLAFIFKYLQQLPTKELHLAPHRGRYNVRTFFKEDMEIPIFDIPLPQKARGV